MPQLHTAVIASIGYEGRDVGELVEVLKRNRIDRLVDVRLNAISRKRGFSKSALASALAEARIEYQHEPRLGNPADNRDGFRRGMPSARSRYARHLANGARETFLSVVNLSKSSRIALLCFERDHSTCHRSCIIEQAQAEHPTISLLRL